MAGQTQEQQLDISQKQKERQSFFPWKLALVLLIFVALLAMLAVWILSILNVLPTYWASIVYAILTIVGIATPIIVLVVIRDKPAPAKASPPAPAISPQPVVVQVQYLPQHASVPPSQPPVQEGSSYRDIIGFLPLT
ncbi:MAG: hypothetical protein ABI406_11075, partial [Ktedonobacteraceae bacterium]